MQIIIEIEAFLNIGNKPGLIGTHCYPWHFLLTLRLFFHCFITLFILRVSQHFEGTFNTYLVYLFYFCCCIIYKIPLNKGKRGCVLGLLLVLFILSFSFKSKPGNQNQSQNQEVIIDECHWVYT